MSLWGCEELYVTGLPADVTEPELRGLFGTHGTVKEAVIVNKKGPSGPNAPQSMAAHADAVKAKKALHKYDWMGKQISVKWSHNQRVLWVTNLHESVTNEVLQSAFAQFGAVSKAVVACDAPNNTSKGWGFVAFENKRFAVKALDAIRQRPFLIGAGLRPVVADWARNEEVVEGFSEENAARFPPPHSKEDMQGGRLLGLRAEYEALRLLIKNCLAEAEKQIIVTGNAPRLAHMLLSDPFFAPPPGYMQPPPPRPPMGPAPPPPHGHMGGPPPMGPPPMGPPPPYNYPPPGPPSGPGPMKRDGESFHHVPPPSKRAMTGNQADRFNPNPNTQSKPEQQQAGQPSQRSNAAFVRGGELHTVNQGESGAIQQAQAEGGTAPPAAGSKPPGSHDHGGIGFSGSSTPAGGAGQGKGPASAGAPQGGSQAPYTTYQYPYSSQQGGQAPPSAQGAGTYGSGAPPSYQQPQQHQQQYGSYGAPPPSTPGQAPQQASYQQPAGAYAPTSDQQQYQYGSYNGYNYYQQQSTQPGQAPPYPGGPPPSGPSPSGHPGQQQPPYGAPPPQQSMYSAPPPGLPGQGYYS
ncbi:hypothetical protein VOLCADRAFT_116517 [Volvox carteri f. nagariensis]|uniref:RRM domain-containing protein n=1 Tax=Volvox carteri f. nagariensis TaxID=3068 RepID=D8TMQ3_VOLCA|nr:uncharacterized protein VOLCADRAFT_116517 [Volvox carteri f. nagariensis]EFJ51166.1 hypothetical protein VOLCADRAFT_116517 [Volvox carteri f. nagariensis]|eukprot:XP_002947633.1 hypothetical protein VOLCADRAFT_116517 [Volvox carteri f. nagariensis]